jgi:hypothetical protein
MPGISLADENAPPSLFGSSNFAVSPILGDVPRIRSYHSAPLTDRSIKIFQQFEQRFEPYRMIFKELKKKMMMMSRRRRRRRRSTRRTEAAAPLTTFLQKLNKQTKMRKRFVRKRQLFADFSGESWNLTPAKSVG